MKSTLLTHTTFFMLFFVLVAVANAQGDSSSDDSSSSLVIERGRVKDSRVAIGLALSGGGFRSAAFAHGAILELQRINLCLIREKDTPSTYKYFVFTKLEKIEGCERLGEIGDTTLEVLRKGTLWDNIDMISAVSGGSIAGAFNVWKYPSDDFDKFDENVLSRAEEFRDNLLLPRASSLFLHALDILPLVPGSLMERRCLFCVPWPILAMDMLPTVPGWLLVKEGFASSEEVEEQFEQRVFKNVTMEDVFSDPDKPLLLIHGTNLNDGKIFTFSHHDLNCIEPSGKWQQWPLAKAVAASSAIPGLVSPLSLENHHSPTQEKGNHQCRDLYGDKERNPYIVLADGGIYENLAIDGMIRHFAQEKRELYRRTNQAQRKDILKTKLFIIAVNAETSAAPPGHQQEIEQQIPIASRLNQSFNVLMDSRTDVSRTSVQELERFGIFVEEINFHECLETSYTENPSPSQFCVDRKAEHDTYTNLDSIRTHFPNRRQVATLIASGRRFTAHSVPRMKLSLQRLIEERNPVSCEKFTAESHDYCWPNDWIEHNIYDGPLADRLKSLRQISNALISPSPQYLLNILDRQLEELKQELYPTRGIRSDAPLSSGILVSEKAAINIILLGQDKSYMEVQGKTKDDLIGQLKTLQETIADVPVADFGIPLLRDKKDPLFLDRDWVQRLRSYEIKTSLSGDPSSSASRLVDSVRAMEKKLKNCENSADIPDCFVLLISVHKYLADFERERAREAQQATLLIEVSRHNKKAKQLEKDHLMEKKDILSLIYTARRNFSEKDVRGALVKLEMAKDEAERLDKKLTLTSQEKAIREKIRSIVKESFDVPCHPDAGNAESCYQKNTDHIWNKFQYLYKRPILRAQNNYAFYGALGGFVNELRVKEYAKEVYDGKACKNDVAWEISLCDDEKGRTFQYPSFVDTYATWNFMVGASKLKAFLEGKKAEDLMAQGMVPFDGTREMTEALKLFWQALDASEKVGDPDKLRRDRIASRLAFATKVISRANELFNHVNKPH